jgi:hypothetical protein
MNYVMDPCVLSCLNYPESDPRYRAVARAIDSGTCFVTPMSVAEAYRRIERRSPAMAETMLDVFLSDDLVQVVEDKDRELIQLAVQARKYGVSYAVAFCAALAKKFGIPILAAKYDTDSPNQASEATAIDDLPINEFEIIEMSKFCRIVWASGAR